MHAEIIDFLNRAVHDSGLGSTRGRRVIELGSYILPGQQSVRDVLGDAAESYVGVDWRAGPGVDVVAIAHEAPDLGGADVVACCQALEHDPHWRMTIDRAVRELLRGRHDTGYLFLTWAGPGYPEHELETAPATEDGEPAGTYYRPLSLAEVAGALTASVTTRRGALDLGMRYARGTLDALLWARV